MNRPVRWRASWALAHLTGVLFSTLVWVVLVASASKVAVAALLGGAVAVVVHGTRPLLWLVVGARLAAPDDRDAVLRAIVPVAFLRGRNQPRILVAGRRRAVGWDVLAVSRRTLLVTDQLVAEIRSGRISGVEVSALVAHAFGQLPALGSRVVAAIDIYCLPWGVVDTVVSRIASRLSRLPLMSLSWRMRPVVFGLGLIDAVLHARWEAAVPLVVFSILTYTTGPLERASKRRLAELGDRSVADEGLGQVFAGLKLNPHDPGDRRRAQVLLAVAR